MWEGRRRRGPAIVVALAMLMVGVTLITRRFSKFIRNKITCSCHYVIGMELVLAAIIVLVEYVRCGRAARWGKTTW